MASFAPILVASIVSYVFTKSVFGIEPIFLGSIGDIESLYDFPFFIVAGIICGFISIIYMRGLTHPMFFPNISKIKELISIHKILKKINTNYAIYCSPGHLIDFKPKIKNQIKLKKILLKHQVVKN